MADDGHTINVGPVTIGEPPARPPVDTDIIGTVALVWRANGADATADAIESLCDEVDRLRAAIAAIPRHRPGSAPRGAWLGQWTGMCGNCRIAWPCPTEQAHRLLEADRG